MNSHEFMTSMRKLDAETIHRIRQLRSMIRKFQSPCRGVNGRVTISDELLFVKFRAVSCTMQLGSVILLAGEKAVQHRPANWSPFSSWAATSGSPVRSASCEFCAKLRRAFASARL